LKIFLEIKNDKLLDISDIESDNHNLVIEGDSPDEIYNKLSGYQFDTDMQIEEYIKSLYDDNDSSDTLSSYKIKHWVSNRSFGELIDMYENDEIIVPKMQRNFVWDSLKCSRLIESIVLGLPIPPLFLLEVSDNQYELIDGFQRLTALANYVGGRQWNYDKKNHKKMTASKLSGKVALEIADRSFGDLDEEYKMKIKRSTIPLIEFKQLDPMNYDSKYLIFERINTGSVKLNSMQIRKSLSYGPFIESLYEGVEKMSNLKDIFSVTSIKKDNDVEAVLRTICFYSYYYAKKFIPTSRGMKNILNEYCEEMRNNPIDSQLLNIAEKSIDILIESFESKVIFRRIETDENMERKFVGYLNISIFESLTSAVMWALKDSLVIDKNLLYQNYISVMGDISERGIKTGVNPFNISTGTIESIQERFNIANKIVRDSIK
jgi:hypothetical protein